MVSTERLKNCRPSRRNLKTKSENTQDAAVCKVSPVLNARLTEVMERVGFAILLHVPGRDDTRARRRVTRCCGARRNRWCASRHRITGTASRVWTFWLTRRRSTRARPILLCFLLALQSSIYIYNNLLSGHAKLSHFPEQEGKHVQEFSA